jgi:hypothetical protein
MSHNDRETRGPSGNATAADSSSHASERSERAPQLRPGGYAAWKASMNVYLQRNGAQGVHMKELSKDDWLQDVKDVEQWSSEALTNARAAARAGAVAASSAGPVSKTEGISDEVKAARAAISANVSARTRRTAASTRPSQASCRCR